jgi:D,D-heptose 1,7-bisphosphate phosphatase
MEKAVFIDKDGTLIKNIPFNVNPLLVGFEKKVMDGLRLLQQHGFKKIIISNQPGIALGYYEEQALEKVNRQIQEMLRPYSISIDAFYYCPHHPQGKIEAYAVQCNCRKPMPGLIERAAYEHDIELHNSWMIGDILDDVEAGNKAGCATILVNNGGETEWVLNEERMPGHIVKDFFQAAAIICNG